MREATFTLASDGRSHLMLGNVVCTTMLAGTQSSGELTMVVCSCTKDTGPGPHTDPWRESFLVLDGEFEFQLERKDELVSQIAKRGDAISVPAGIGHAFHATSETARLLILSVPAGLDAFFAAAGEPGASDAKPQLLQSFDRRRFEEACQKYGIRRFEQSAHPSDRAKPTSSPRS